MIEYYPGILLKEEDESAEITVRISGVSEKYGNGGKKVNVNNLPVQIPFRCVFVDFNNITSRSCMNLEIQQYSYAHMLRRQLLTHLNIIRVIQPPGY